MSKVYGVVVAGGVGSRMGNMEKPKQFLDLGGKPIIIHTIEKFAVHPGFDGLIVLVPGPWISYTKDIIRRNIPAFADTITVLEGGKTRNDTIMNAIRFIEEQGDLDDDTVVVTHDAVRPFLTHRIIEENIRFAKEYGACDTAIPASDTIAESLDHEKLTSIPDRKYMYQGQTPQSFKARLLRDEYLALTDDERAILTDACKIMVLKGHHVHLVQGEVYNIKITYPYDITVAKALLGLTE